VEDDVDTQVLDDGLDQIAQPLFVGDRGLATTDLDEEVDVAAPKVVSDARPEESNRRAHVEDVTDSGPDHLGLVGSKPHDLAGGPALDPQGKTGKMAPMATTTLSSKGQLVIPKDVRRALRLRAGSRLQVSLHEGRIILEPERETRARLVTERGRRLLVAPPNAPDMTTEEVRKLLADFP